MKGEIKPCPFCGENPSFVWKRVSGKIECKGCDLEMKYSHMFSWNENLHRRVLTERWNKRS